MIVRDRGKGSNLNFLQGSPWADERYYYLQVSTHIVTIVSLICATSEIVFGCWSVHVLAGRIPEKGDLSSTRSKLVVIGVAIFVTLSARITALIVWMRSTRNENLRCYSVTSHCTFVTVFVMLGLGSLLIYFLSVAFDFTTNTFRPHSEVLLAFIYISGFDILFSATFGCAVTNDLQCKIRREWQYAGASQCCTSPRENWVRPCHVPNKWNRPLVVTEVYV